MNFLFVGENRSETAVRKGWYWQDGCLAAKTLFAALTAANIGPSAQKFINLFDDFFRVDKRALAKIRRTKLHVTAMGCRVAKVLAEEGVEHRHLTHPAARGKIRKTELYQAHVKEVLYGVGTG